MDFYLALPAFRAGRHLTCSLSLRPSLSHSIFISISPSDKCIKVRWSVAHAEMSLFRVANVSFPLMPVQLCVRGSAVSMRLSGEVLSVRNDCGKQTKLASTHCANCRLRALTLFLYLFPLTALPLTRSLRMAVVVILLKHHLGKIVLMMLISPHTLDSLECLNGVFQSLPPHTLLLFSISWSV